MVAEYRAHLDILAGALLEKETLEREEIERLLDGLEPESNASSKIGVMLPPEVPRNGHVMEPLLRSDPGDQAPGA